MEVSLASLLATTHIRTFVAAENETSAKEELVHVQKEKHHWELHYNLSTFVMPTSIPGMSTLPVSQGMLSRPLGSVAKTSDFEDRFTIGPFICTSV